MLSVIDHLSHHSSHGKSSAGLRCPDFTAIAPDRGRLAAEFLNRGIPVVSISFHDENGLRSERSAVIARLLKIVQKLQPDILHANSLAMARLTGSLPSECLKLSMTGNQSQTAVVRRIGHLRDIIHLNPSTIRDLNRNDTLIAVSEATKQNLANQGLDAGRCTVIHNGVNPEVFGPGTRELARHRVLPQIPDDAFVILTAGQICLRKGQRDTAEVIVEILKEGSPIPLHWVVAGDRFSAKPESLAYEQAIRTTFSNAGFDANLHLLGFRDDIPDLMNASNVLIHAARQEPFGRVLLEAASSGLPIIASDVGGTPELLSNEQHALLFPAGNLPELKQLLQRLMNDAELRTRLSANSRSRIVEMFTVQKAAERLYQHWNLVLTSSPIPEAKL